ncbi:MAG: hydrogenase maturation nickel metallochaperone HypA [Bacteroidetes bacterium]|jgi:hydrogenase nickel incorporation protein HypA/HybF|nr:hydrogenase maturation nickel metallochaperone HypA [Bacteroidota bacterium]
MHELSIARAIATIVCDLVPPSDRPHIRNVTVDVGHVSGIVPDSLSFCFEALSAELSLPPHALVIRRVPFRCYCRPCATEFSNDSGIVLCPSCGSADTEVRSGRDLRVATIEIAESNQDRT